MGRFGKARPGRRRRILLRVAALLLFGPLLLILLFRFVPPPVTPLMLVRQVQGHGLDYRYVPYARIAPALVDSVIASEDNRFCEQRLGVAVPELAEQIQAWGDGEAARGASTIAMQTTRNLLLWPGRDIVRKAAEIWLTPQLALLWPKRRILEVYLNIIEFGPGIYGAEAAAQATFGKSAAQLTAAEAARLAMVLPNPLERAADELSPRLAARAQTIRHRISQLGPLLDCAHD